MLFKTLLLFQLDVLSVLTKFFVQEYYWTNIRNAFAEIILKLPKIIKRTFYDWLCLSLWHGTASKSRLKIDEFFQNTDRCRLVISKNTMSNEMQRRNAVNWIFVSLSNFKMIDWLTDWTSINNSHNYKKNRKKEFTANRKSRKPQMASAFCRNES